MLSLKEFKQLVKTSPLINIHNAPVKAKANAQSVYLEWRGLDTGTLFGGSVDAVNLKDAKFTGTNEVSIRLANVSGEKVNYNAHYTSINFWHVVEVPIM